MTEQPQNTSGTPSEAPALRCAPHGLATDHQGRCVLCRREQGLASEPPASRSRAPASAGPSAVSMLLGVAGFVLLAAASWWWIQEPPPPAPLGKPAAEPPQAPAAPEVQPDLERRARQAERARAERMLREAEAQRRQLEAQRRSPTPGTIPTDPAALRHDEAVPTAATDTIDQHAETRRRRAEQLRREREKRQRQRALARAEQDVAITLYSTQWCGVCKQAVHYMRRKNIPFTEHDVDHEPAAAAALRQLNPRGSVPTFDIEGQVLVGFSPRELARAIHAAAHARVR